MAAEVGDIMYLDELTGLDPDADYFEATDVSDTTMDASGTAKRINGRNIILSSIDRGRETLVGGAVTVHAPAYFDSTYEVFLSRRTPGGVIGDLSIDNIVDGVSFDIVSSNALDTSVVSWMII